MESVINYRNEIDKRLSEIDKYLELDPSQRTREKRDYIFEKVVELAEISETEIPYMAKVGIEMRLQKLSEMGEGLV